jgi:hypothetical protein
MSGPLVMPDGDLLHPHLDRSFITVAFTDGNGQPISGISVNLSGKTDKGEALNGTGVITTSDGLFVFRVPPGNYTISRVVPPTDKIVGGSQVVTVSGGYPATVSFTV